MDILEDWLIHFSTSQVVGILTLIFSIFLLGIWQFSNFLEKKDWGLFLKIPIAIVITFLTMSIINLVFLIGLRNLSFDVLFFLKSVIEGLLVPLFFIKIIPNNGKKIANIFVILLTVFYGFVTYQKILYAGLNSLGLTLIVPHILFVTSMFISYFKLSEWLIEKLS